MIEVIIQSIVQPYQTYCTKTQISWSLFDESVVVLITCDCGNYAHLNKDGLYQNHIMDWTEGFQKCRPKPRWIHVSSYLNFLLSPERSRSYGKIPVELIFHATLWVLGTPTITAEHRFSFFQNRLIFVSNTNINRVTVKRAFTRTTRFMVQKGLRPH